MAAGIATKAGQQEAQRQALERELAVLNRQVQERDEVIGHLVDQVDRLEAARAAHRPAARPLCPGA